MTKQLSSLYKAIYISDDSVSVEESLLEFLKLTRFRQVPLSEMFLVRKARYLTSFSYSDTARHFTVWVPPGGQGLVHPDEVIRPLRRRYKKIIKNALNEYSA